MQKMPPVILTGTVFGLLQSFGLGLAGISETREHASVSVKKIGSSDSIFGLVNSTYFFLK